MNGHQEDEREIAGDCHSREGYEMTREQLAGTNKCTDCQEVTTDMINDRQSHAQDD